MCRGQQSKIFLRGKWSESLVEYDKKEYHHTTKTNIRSRFQVLFIKIILSDFLWTPLNWQFQENVSVQDITRKKCPM